MLPILLNLTGRRCLVVGGGTVGRRRALTLLGGDADVLLVCLEPPAPLGGPREPTWRQEPYRREHLEGMTLVCAAAPPPVNEVVSADARKLGIWFNRADAAAASDFHFPAIHRQGDLVLAVSTEGAAPKLSQQICQKLEREYDEAYGKWVVLLRELQPMIRGLGDDVKRQDAWRMLTATDWIQRLRQDGPEATRAAMLEVVRRLHSATP